ncbi:MAG: hypothetical protein RLZ98_2730 [Pseudomonadota bacterium]
MSAGKVGTVRRGLKPNAPKGGGCERPAAASDGSFIELPPRKRLSKTGAGAQDWLYVAAGVLAIEASPSGGRRQIVDFLVPGDLVIGATLSLGQLNIRAMSGATLQRCSAPHVIFASAGELRRRVEHGVFRGCIRQLIIGQLDVESRVSTFLLDLALRTTDGALRDEADLDLPMARDDIADYICINADTLSRIMMRFEKQGYIRRHNRHRVKLLCIEGLRASTPIADLLFSSMKLNDVGPAPQETYNRVMGADIVTATQHLRLA